MRIFYHDQFVLPLPEGHRFPMAKYARLRERVSADLELRHARLEVGPSSPDDELLLAHDSDYVHRVANGSLTPAEVRRIGFPWSPGMVERSRRSVGSTVEAARAALVDGVAVNLAGGTHHAFAARGQGFCVFNDVAVAARVAQRQEGIRRIVVLDCDVHQGNGTAAIFRADPTVFTLSVHGASNFPFEKETSDLDVALPDGTGDQPYLAELEHALDVAFASGPFDLAFYVSGADPYERDRLGKLDLSREGLARRDALVFEKCLRSHVPVAVSMAGGYAKEIEDIVAIHLETVRQSMRFHESWSALGRRGSGLERTGVQSR
ncbi:MAG: histone deacetylase [Candidatus Eisenbacteria bacterium]|nr:histone deacetylase [Candidatus Eisenbacteria bacterium]